MRNLSSWRSVRLWESEVEHGLRQRRSLWLHGLALGTITLALMWGVSHAQMLLGMESLALRYAVTLGIGYLAYLLLVRVWAAALLRRNSADAPDLSGVDVPIWNGAGGSSADSPPFAAGGGGDFAGGGASADFSGAGHEGASNLAGGALEALSGADEGAVVVVPVVAIFLIGCAVFFGAGALLLLYFGWEVLLAVAVELAFSYVSARAAVRVTREGWASAAIRLTWKPLAGALCCGVVLGATIDHFIPSAHTLPQAVKAIKAQLKS